VFAAGARSADHRRGRRPGGANRYFGWYFGAPDDLLGPAPGRPARQASAPSRCRSPNTAPAARSASTPTIRWAVRSTRSAASSPRNTRATSTRPPGRPCRKPYLWGTWLWNAFDFATTIRHEGDADDINTKGLVTYDRKIRKDAWYFYKANWAPTPTVHITGRRYVDRAYPVTDVRVYSNGPSTDLVVNGKSLGALADCPQNVCVWWSPKAGSPKASPRGTRPGTA
jgi:beta-galactosidase